VIRRLQSSIDDAEIRQRAEGLVAIIAPILFEQNNPFRIKHIDDGYMSRVSLKIAEEFSKLTRETVVERTESHLKSLPLMEMPEPVVRSMEG